MYKITITASTFPHELKKLLIKNNFALYKIDDYTKKTELIEAPLSKIISISNNFNYKAYYQDEKLPKDLQLIFRLVQSRPMTFNYEYSE